jgi:hypothetical protein
MPPALTVGMAVIDDFHGIYFSVQALKLYHPAVNIVVVDNKPESKHGQFTAALCKNVGAKYVPMSSPKGTSPTRNRVIDEAETEFVICIDPHVMFYRYALDEVYRGIDNKTLGDDLYSGPLMMDDGDSCSTHFNREWRSEMYGTWGRAWQCPCHSEVRFTCIQDGDKLSYRSLCDSGEQPVLTVCKECGVSFPTVGWAGHEKILLDKGFISLGKNDEDDPFETIGHGLGMFLTRKDSWLRFVDNSVGFGGEEICVHDVYRQAGRKSICLPYLKWIHRFGRPDGNPYVATLYHKLRNYVLWFNRLGKPLDEIYEHFITTKLSKQEEWDHLVADPINHVDPPPGCSSCGPKLTKPEILESAVDAFNFLKPIERDINQHMDKLRELASQCKSITEFTIRRESTIALLASDAINVTSYSGEYNDETIVSLSAIRKGFQNRALALSPQRIEITDLLFLNTEHTANRVMQELLQYGGFVGHYIVLHNTRVFGEKGEDGKPGILYAVREFMRKNPEWSVVYHTDVQHGLIVMSRVQADKPSLPSVFTRAANLSLAVAEYVKSGMENVTPEVFSDRLDICSLCPSRVDMTCSECGCYLSKKASMAISECPLLKWKSV